MQAEKMKLKVLEKENEDNKRKELKLITDMLKEEKEKIKICTTSKRKFSSLE